MRALRGKLRQVRLLDQNAGKVLVCGLVEPVWVVPLPPFKFGARLVSSLPPNVGSGDLLSGVLDLLDVCIDRRAPVAAVGLASVSSSWR
jgi:hypothetical protein